MGCAQETFEEILGFLHREHVDPNYLESCFAGVATEKQKWEYENDLNDAGCTPPCAAHDCFGIQTTALTRCDRCDLVDEVQ